MINLKMLTVLALGCNLGCSSAVMIENRTSAIDYKAIEDLSPEQQLQNEVATGKLITQINHTDLIVNFVDQEGGIVHSEELTKQSEDKRIEGDKIHVTSVFTYQLGDETKKTVQNATYDILTKTNVRKNKETLQEVFETCKYYEVNEAHGQIQRHRLDTTNNIIPATFKRLLTVKDINIIENKTELTIQGTFAFSDGEEFTGEKTLPCSFQTIGWQRIGDSNDFVEQLKGQLVYDGQTFDISSYGSPRQASLQFNYTDRLVNLICQNDEQIMSKPLMWEKDENIIENEETVTVDAVYGYDMDGRKLLRHKEQHPFLKRDHLYKNKENLEEGIETLLFYERPDNNMQTIEVPLRRAIKKTQNVNVVTLFEDTPVSFSNSTPKHISARMKFCYSDGEECEHKVMYPLSIFERMFCYEQLSTNSIYRDQEGNIHLKAKFWSNIDNAHKEYDAVLPPVHYKTDRWERIGNGCDFEEQKGAFSYLGTKEVDLSQFIHISGAIKTVSKVENLQEGNGFILVARQNNKPYFNFNGRLTFTDGSTVETPVRVFCEHVSYDWYQAENDSKFKKVRKISYVMLDGNTHYYNYIEKTTSATIKTAEQCLGEEGGRRKFRTEYETPESEVFWVYRFDEIPVVQRPAPKTAPKPAESHSHGGPSNEFERFGKYVSSDCSIM